MKHALMISIIHQSTLASIILIDHVVYDQIAEWEQKVQHASSGGPGAKVLSLCSASLEDLFVVLQEFY
jgi:hypothetical protein